MDDIGGAEGSQSVQHDTSTGLSDLCASGMYGGRPPEAGREAVCQDAVEQAAAPSFASILARAPPRQREVRHLATQDKLLWVLQNNTKSTKILVLERFRLYDTFYLGYRIAQNSGRVKLWRINCFR